MTDLTTLVDHLGQHGAWIIFGFVLLEEFGAPIPSTPLLVIAGGLIFDGKLGFISVTIATLVASAIANLCWFFAGRKYGYKILRFLCRVSLSPDSCVRMTESSFERWGGLALVASKFIPGFGAMAPPLAGALRFSVLTFLAYDLLGVLTLLWLCTGIGYVFHSTINECLKMISQVGASAVGFFVLLLGVYIFYKWLRRYLFLRDLRMARITVAELNEMIKKDPKPLILDVRSQKVSGQKRIPGAVVLEKDNLQSQLAVLPKTHEIVLYCNCPNEASAVIIARTLLSQGYTRVRPLKGGLDAWIEAGLSYES